jgi:hypothetical protein
MAQPVKQRVEDRPYFPLQNEMGIADIGLDLIPISPFGTFGEIRQSIETPIGSTAWRQS